MMILSNILKIKLLVFGILIIFVTTANFYWLPNGIFFGKEIALTILGGFLAINLLFNRGVKFDFTLVDLLITVFLLYSTSLFWFNDYHPSLLKWVVVTTTFSLYFFVIKALKKEGKLESLVFIFIITFSIQAIIGLVQVLKNAHIPLFERSLFIKGSFSNPAPYASFLSLGLILVLSLLLFYYVKGFKKWCLIFLSFFYASLLILSASRTAIIASVLGVCFLLFRKYNLNIRRFFNKKLFGLLCILSFILGVILLAQINTDSISGRFFIWKISSEIIKDKPIAGIGPGNFQSEYMNYQSKYFENISHNTSEALLADNNNFAFNELIHITSETGVIGLLLILLIIVLIFYYGFKSNKIEHEILLALFITFFSISFFSYPLNEIPLLLVLVTILSLFSAFIEVKVFFNPKKYIFIPFLLCIVALICFWQWNQYKAYKHWADAKQESYGGNMKVAIRGYEKANKTLNQDGFFLFNYGCTLSEEGYCKQAIPILIRTSNFYNEHFVWEKLGDCYMESNYLEALKCYQKSINMSPHRFIPMYKIFELHKLHENHSKAAEIANEILKKKIKIPSEIIGGILDESSAYLK